MSMEKSYLWKQQSNCKAVSQSCQLEWNVAQRNVPFETTGVSSFTILWRKDAAISKINVPMLTPN